MAEFFNVHYKPTMSGDDDVTMKMQNLRQILGYAATGIVTEHETNIKQHFVDYIEKFINAVCGKNDKWKDLDTNAKADLMRHYGHTSPSSSTR